MTKEKERELSLKIKQTAIQPLAMANLAGPQFFDEYVKENETALRTIFGTAGKSGKEQEE
jgi:hypothetical protein